MGDRCQTPRTFKNNMYAAISATATLAVGTVGMWPQGIGVRARIIFKVVLNASQETTPKQSVIQKAEPLNRYQLHTPGSQERIRQDEASARKTPLGLACWLLTVHTTHLLGASTGRV